MNQPNQPPDQKSPKPVSGREAYNIVSDTVVGVNVRWKDNLFQTIAIVVFLGLGVFVGFMLAPDQDSRTPAMVMGAFAGLVIGFLASGTFLMIFRAVQHGRGKHG